MASTTVVTTPATSSDGVASLSNISASTALTSARSGSLAVSSSLDSRNKAFHDSMQPPQMQSQPSSQQSFTMSQPSSQQNVGNNSMYRQYNESARHPNENVQVMPIYSVRSCIRLSSKPPNTALSSLIGHILRRERIRNGGQRHRRDASSK